MSMRKFRRNGLRLVGKKASELRRPMQLPPKDPKKVLKQRFYEDWLKGLDNDKH